MEEGTGSQGVVGLEPGHSSRAWGPSGETHGRLLWPLVICQLWGWSGGVGAKLQAGELIVRGCGPPGERSRGRAQDTEGRACSWGGGR